MISSVIIFKAVSTLCTSKAEYSVKTDYEAYKVANIIEAECRMKMQEKHVERAILVRYLYSKCVIHS